MLRGGASGACLLICRTAHFLPRGLLYSSLDIWGEPARGGCWSASPPSGSCVFPTFGVQACRDALYIHLLYSPTRLVPMSPNPAFTHPHPSFCSHCLHFCWGLESLHDGTFSIISTNPPASIVPPKSTPKTMVIFISSHSCNPVHVK